jgi:putative hydrolase of the HAD superfamily
LTLWFALMLKAVLFDLDETLIPEWQPLDEAWAAVARELLRTEPSEDQIGAVYDSACEYWDRNAPEPSYRARVHFGRSDGLCSEMPGNSAEALVLRDFLPVYRANAFLSVTPPSFSGTQDDLIAAWRHRRFQNQGVYPGAQKLLGYLGERYKLGLVTNGPSDIQRHKLRITGLQGYFDFVVISGDIGIGKPDPEPFRVALEALGVSANEAMMIGNDEARDIAGAAAAGLRSLLVQPGPDPVHGAITDLASIPGLLSTDSFAPPDPGVHLRDD